MKREDLIQIGQIYRSHGLEGELKVGIDSFYIDQLPQLQAWIIEKGEDFLPFFVEKLQINSQPMLVKFESIDSKEGADQLHGKTIFALKDQVQEKGPDQKKKMVGYQVLDADNQNVGTIQEVLELPSQIVLQVNINNQEVFIPFHEQLVKKIDDVGQQIIMEIPDGLLEIYTSHEEE